ncbi:uncharacterized protein C4orf54 homolog [Podargus strigoides]
MDAPGQPPAGPRTGPGGAAAGRGPGPEAAIEEEKAAAYVEIRVSSRGPEESRRPPELAPAGGAERAAGAAAESGAGGTGDVGGEANGDAGTASSGAAGCGAESGTECGGAAGSGGEPPAPGGCPESSSSSCPSPVTKAGSCPAMGDPVSTEGKTSSSSFGYESEEEDGAGRKAAPPGGGRDEAHYISTQEIQLSEVDHDMDFDAGLAARWDFEDNNVIYSFVDYASFGSDETPRDTPTEEEENSCYLSTTTSDPNNQTDSIDNTSSTEIVSLTSEHDTPGGEKRASPGDSRCGRPGGGAAPQLLLSITAAARAINESSNVRGKQNTVHSAKHESDMSLRVPAAPERHASLKADAVRDHAKKFIAVPARLQTRCGAGGAGEHSSGASSAVSELDDADKEVRTLTARAFRSLAYPYLEPLCAGSRASSASLPDSAPGISRWSAYLDLKCGGLGPSAEPRRLRSARPQTQALEFVVSKLDGEIAHVEAPRRLRAGSRVVTLLDLGHGPGAAEGGGGGSSKKSKFASSLLKNVISKKMQLEHEFKMERGELTDTSHAGLGAGREPESAGGRERQREGGVQRQSSRHSEGGSDGTAAAAEGAGEGGGGRSPVSKASAPRDGSRSRDQAVPEELCEVKRSASEAIKATFLRSQNSAFRSWREREAERKEERAPVGKLKLPPRHDWRAGLGDTSAGKSTKMSRLFVPAIQHSPREKEPGQRATKWPAAASSPPAAQPRVPEIKISLGSLQPPRDAAFSISQLLTPQIAGRPSEEGGGQQPKPPKVGDGSEKVPQFLVRDVRDSKPRAQGPLHQVRDVRKLIKSSYSCDSGDNSSDRGSVASDQGGPEQKPRQQLLIAGVPRSLSPVVITCQAVGHTGTKPTEGGGKAAGKAVTCPPEGTVLVHRTSGRLPVATIAPNKSNPRQPAVLKIVSKPAAPWRQQQPPLPPAERGRGPEEDAREEGKTAPVPNALEKLTAAVRSMEELYSFNNREWKRKSDPLPITDSHVLSLIASQERGTGTRPTPPAAAPAPPAPPPAEKAEEPSGRGPGSERLPRRPSNSATDKVSAKAAAFESLARQRQRGPPAPRAEPRTEPSAAPRALLTLRGAAAPAAGKPIPEGGPRGPAARRSPRLPAGGGDTERGPDCGNYLALPLKAGAGPGSPPSPLPGAGGGVRPSAVSAAAAAAALCGPQPFGSAKRPGSPAPPAPPPAEEPPAAAPAPAEGPPAALYRPPLPFATLPGAAPPLLCFSPSAAAAAEPFPQTQRKVLLDVSTGQYYLVDTPLQQPLKRRLFDPETGQYVEVPVPPQTAVAPLPLPLSPLALNAGAYGATYMLYPGLLPAAAMLPAGTLPRPLSHPGSDASAPAEPGSPATAAAEATFTDSPYYVATGKGPPPPRHGAAEAKPVISITAPATGPRIVAPPSFDGTTMRFVVEHR